MTDRFNITRELPPLPFRGEDAHKGDFGRVMVLGGCDGETTMIGAVALTANAALRSGSGLVRAAVPASLVAPIGILAPCVTFTDLEDDADELLRKTQDFDPDVLAIGPGLGDSISTEVLLHIINGVDRPVVLDADGLNTLAQGHKAELAQPEKVIMTPHAGELQRLLKAGSNPVRIDGTLARRRDAIAALLDLYGCIVVLKGHHTLVAGGERLYINETGNAGMATAGTGDVLTGVIASLVGQKTEPFEAAVLGAYLHGLAGDFAVEELPRSALTAVDLIEYLPESFTDYESSTSELP